jgi:hypothetical protein
MTAVQRIRHAKITICAFLVNQTLPSRGGRELVCALSLTIGFAGGIRDVDLLMAKLRKALQERFRRGPNERNSSPFAL